MVGGLSALGKWADAVDSYGALAAVAPVGGESAGTAVDLKSILATQFEASVASFLQNSPNASANDLVTFLSNFSVTADGLTISANGVQKNFNSKTNDLLITLDLTANGTSSVGLNLNSLSGGQPIGFDHSASGTLTTHFDFNFSFGLNLTSYLDVRIGPAARRHTLAAIHTAAIRARSQRSADRRRRLYPERLQPDRGRQHRRRPRCSHHRHHRARRLSRCHAIKYRHSGR